jgi:hypothetical protein
VLAQLGEHKRLPVEFLEGLGLHDLSAGGVAISYKNAGGMTVTTKVRHGLTSSGDRWPLGQRLLPYGEDRLADAAEAGALALVEGESDCWTLWHHGFPALGLPGKDSPAKALDVGHVACVRDLYVVQEADDAGPVFVGNVRNRLAELGWKGTLRVVRMTVAKDPSALHCLDPGQFPDRWREMLAKAEAVEVDSVPATPAGPFLPPEPPWPDPPDDAAFHGLAGDVVRTILPHSEADAVALLAQTLVMFGSAIGRTAHFRVEGDTHYLNEFLVLVGKTGKGRKGTSFGQCRRTFEGWLDDWLEERIQSGASSGEGIVWHVRDPVMTRHPTKEKGRVTGYEEIESDPGITDKRLLLYEPEFASVLKQAERQGNTLSTTLRQAWERGNLRNLVKNSPARATGAHVSALAHITAEEIRRYLTATEAANGFGNRFLWFCVRRSKCLPRGGLVPEATLAHLRQRLQDAYEHARQVGEMGMDAGGLHAWDTVYPELSEGQPGMAGALLSRGEAHVMRLACLYALLDMSAEVGREHLEAALALWEYAEASVRYVFGAALGDTVADELYQALRSCPAGLTRTEIRDLFGRHQKGDRIATALAALLKAGLAHCRREQTDGRAAERWYAGRATEATNATEGGSAP